MSRAKTAFMHKGQACQPAPRPVSAKAAMMHQGQDRQPLLPPGAAKAAFMLHPLHPGCPPDAVRVAHHWRQPGVPTQGETYAPWILVPNPVTGEYNFTKPVAYLLSLVSGVSLETISTVVVQSRKLGQYRPWYQGRTSIGGLTLGTRNYKTITYTENLFRAPAYNDGHGYAFNTYDWLSLSSHEVGHLPQIDRAGGLFAYLGQFIGQYASNFSHDGAPLEKEAEKGAEKFVDFRTFVNKRHGFGALERLIEAPHTYDNTKISLLRRWWQEYQPAPRPLSSSRAWGVLLLTCVLGLAGCQTNEVHVDLATQALRPCSSHILTSVSVEAAPPAVSYVARWEGGNPLPGEFSFLMPAAGFRITEDGTTPIPHERFKLTPNTTYEVRAHAPSDAGDGKLIIYTGPDGRIVRTGPPCE